MLTTMQHHQRCKFVTMRDAMRLQRDPTSVLGSRRALEQKLAETKPVHPVVAMALAHSSDGLRWRPPPPASIHLHRMARPASASSLLISSLVQRSSFKRMRQQHSSAPEGGSCLSSSSMPLIRVEHPRAWMPPVPRGDWERRGPGSLSAGARSPDPPDYRDRHRPGSELANTSSADDSSVLDAATLAPPPPPWRSPVGARIPRAHETPSGLHLSQPGLPHAEVTSSHGHDGTSVRWVPAGRPAMPPHDLTGGAYSSNARDLFSVSAGARRVEEPPPPPQPPPLLAGAPPNVHWVPAANAREPRYFETATRLDPTPYEARLDAHVSREQARQWLKEDACAATAGKDAAGEGGEGGNASSLSAGGAAWVPPGRGATPSVFSVEAGSTGVAAATPPPRSSMPSFATKQWVPAHYARQPREFETATRSSPSPFAARLGAHVTAAQATAWAEEEQAQRASSPALLATRASAAGAASAQPQGEAREGRAWVPPGQAAASACFSVSPGRRLVQ